MCKSLRFEKSTVRHRVKQAPSVDATKFPELPALQLYVAIAEWLFSSSRERLKSSDKTAFPSYKGPNLHSNCLWSKIFADSSDALKFLFEVYFWLPAGTEPQSF